MNRIYRVVWSTSLGMYQVASEVASSHGKATRSVDRRARRAAVAAAALMAASGAAMAQTVGSVTGYDGQATQLYRGVQDGGQTWDWDGNILSVLVDGTRSVNFTGAFGEIVLDQGVSFRGDTVGALIRTPVGLDSLLTNNGTIIGTATGVSVSGALGRLINNGLIYGDQSGVQSSGTIGLLANYGQIVSGTLGVLNSGQLGTLTNVGTISVNNNVPGRSGVLNQGTISNLGNMGWIGVARGGNEAAISNAGRIDNLTNQTGGTISGDYGVLNQRTTSAPVSVGTITNTGVITGGLVGVYNAGGGITSLSNYGTIDATSAGASVYGLNNSTTTIGGTVYNATLGSIVNGGTITGYGGAIQNSGSIDEIHNLATGRIDGGASGTGILTGAAGSRIGTINNDSGGVIRGLNAIAIAAGGGTIGTINNAGTIQGNIVNNGSAELTINGDAGGGYGLLTGFDGTSVGSLESPTSNVRFASGNLILNDNVNLGNAFTLLNSGARLHLDRTISVYGNYQQDAGATLEIGVGSGATTTGDRTSDSGYGRLVVQGLATLMPGTTIALQSMGYAFASGQRYVVLETMDWSSPFNEASLNYVISGSTLVGSGVRQANGSYLDLIVTLIAPSAVGTIGGTASLLKGVPSSGTGWSFDGTNVSITGSTFGTVVGSIGTIANTGTLTGTSAMGIAAIYGSVDRFVNDGTIASTGPNNSGFFNGGTVGTLVNHGAVRTSTRDAVNNTGTMTTFENTGTITGVLDGLANYGSLTSVQNTGTMSASTGYGALNTGHLGQLTNQGLILGWNGLVNYASATIAAPATLDLLTNSGVITGAQNGLSNNGSTITKIDNQAGGAITGTGGTGNTIVSGIENLDLTANGTLLAGTIGTISNAGTIAGSYYGISNGSNIGLIDNLAGGVITGLGGAISNQATSASIGAIRNAGTIAGWIINRSQNELSISGATDGSFGTFTGFGGGANVGTIVSTNADVRLTGGNLLVNNDFELRTTIGGNVTGMRTLHNVGSLLQVNRPLSIFGNYDQSANATLQIGVAGADSPNYGSLLVSGSTYIAPGSTIALQSMGYAFAAGQRYVVIDTAGTINYNESTLRYVINGNPTLAANGAHQGTTLLVTLFTPQYLGVVNGTTNLVAGVTGGDASQWRFDGANLDVSGTAQASITGHLGTITNTGTIASTIAGKSALGIASNGGQVDSVVNNGVISASGGTNSGLYAGGVVGTILNVGTIVSDNLGGVNNTGALARLENRSLIQGATLGVANTGSLTTLVNAGTIAATTTASNGVGVWGTGEWGVLTNSGRITGYTGVMLAASGDLARPSSFGLIENNGALIGQMYGLANYGGSIAAINNLAGGTITAGTGVPGQYAVGLNNASQWIGGTLFAGTIGAINNAGTISGAYYGIYNDASIGTINNRAGGLITGVGGAISNQATTSSIDAINNAGTIAGWIINRSPNVLKIAGATDGTYGTLTGFGSVFPGTIVSTNADTRFTGGRLVLDDHFELGGVRTVHNDASVLQINRTLNVDGNFDQAAGGTLQVGVASNAVTTGDMTTDSGYGRLVVTGSTTLAPGSRIALQSLGYSFAVGQRYVVIDTAGTANYNEGSLSYRVNGSTTLGATGANVANGTKRDLVLTVISDPNAGKDDGNNGNSGNGGNSGSTGGGAGTTGGGAGGNAGGQIPSFDPRTNATIASTQNAQSALRGLLGYTGVSNAQLLNLYNATLGSLSDGSTASANRVGNQLAPVQVTRAAGAAAIDALSVVSAHVNGLRTASAGGTGIATGDAAVNWGVWGQAFGGHASQSERDGVDGYAANYGGLLIGADRAFGDRWRAGGAFQFSRTVINNDGATSGNNTSVNGYGLIGYASYTGEPWYVNLSGSVVMQRYNTTRLVSMQGFNGAAGGSFNGQQYVGSAEFGWPLAAGRAIVTPLVGLSYSHLNQPGYTESGGNGAALSVGSASASSVRSALGAKIGVPFETSSGTWMPELSVRWVHEYNRTRLSTGASFAADPSGQTAFTTVGATPVSDLADISLGLTLMRASNMSASIRYNLQAGSGFVSHTGIVRIQQRF